MKEKKIELFEPLSLFDLDPEEEVAWNFVLQEGEALYKKAYSMCGDFVQEAKHQRKESNYQNIGHLGVRTVRAPNNIGIRIQWFMQEYKGVKGKRLAYSDHFKMTKNRSYLESEVFDWRTKDWEKDFFRSMEPQFTILRNYSAQLGKLGMSIRKTLKDREKYSRQWDDLENKGG